MSWSTNFHQTKSDCEGASAAANARTAGSASPSLSPDSRLSEWRMTRGTRGLVTTVEDSTGSVGDSRAPRRNDSVQPRPVSAFVAQATSTHVIGIARTSLRNGSRHAVWSISCSTSSPSRKRIRIRATVASVLTKPDEGSNSSHLIPPSPSAKPATTKIAVSERKLRRARPATIEPRTSRAPSASSECSRRSALPAAITPPRVSETLVEEELRVEEQRGRRPVDEWAAGVEAADAQREGHAVVRAVERLPDEPVPHERVEPDARLVLLAAVGGALLARPAGGAAFAGDQLEGGERLVTGSLDRAAAEARERHVA